MLDAFLVPLLWVLGAGGGLLVLACAALALVTCLWLYVGGRDDSGGGDEP